MISVSEKPVIAEIVCGMKKVKACPLASPDTPRSPSHAAQPNIWRFQKARTLFSKKGPGEVRRNSGMRIRRVSQSVAVCRVADRGGADHSAAHVAGMSARDREGGGEE